MTTRWRVRLLLCCGAACYSAVTSCAAAQKPASPTKPLPAPALALAPLAGKPIAVLPSTFVVLDSDVPGLPHAHAAQLAWADSVFGEALQTRGPEASWMLPAELRRVARRAPGMVSDPDQMGQAVLRIQNMRLVPDPLLGNLRTLVALTGGRYVMVPAAFRITRTSEGVRVESVLVMADARSGAVIWRSTPVAVARDAGAALAATVAHVLPDLH